ncbi:DUF2515 family protein [Virgibacillus salexigens]|uniref:DUF2515 domain-containing protein n=1 Tax=Virgibacillus kapii TaxID=1638645 RepID=A0ABQ2DN16_9BACI|nr:DUF2515 family protein [Virgibacillus kapii]GGJ61264.1 hypothetical protein GCM10007111_24320 [Virgibacillus kapii]
MINCFKKRPKINQKLKKQLKQKAKQLPSSFSKSDLTPWEINIIEQIDKKTTKFNKNNITRTKAYYEFYRAHPEIHWALLGHLVSRNGGWNMTDLKGDLLPRLMTNRERENFFSFLERGNWLIFQDVFPQCLLYQQSLAKQKNLFYLLPYLDVSIFMEVIWNNFWEYRDCRQLAIAMIINEQNYLEERVIQNKHFQDTVLHTIEFKLYDTFRFNHIIFPKLNEITGRPSVVGDTLYQFDELHQRINIGIRLYDLLFQRKARLQAIIQWAAKHPHTGSRSDYWKDLFHPVNESAPGPSYKRRTKNCRLKKGKTRIYSPPLQFAWADVEHKEAKKKDWFHDYQVLYYLDKSEKEIGGEIYDDYCNALEKIELAIIAKNAIFFK